MNVWWCAVQRAQLIDEDLLFCQEQDIDYGCGPMRLVPVDALVLVRDADTLPMLYSYHDEWTPYVNTTLEAQVAEAIRRYPNGDAPGWLAPIAAIKVVEKWLLDALAEAVKDPQ